MSPIKRWFFAPALLLAIFLIFFAAILKFSPEDPPAGHLPNHVDQRAKSGGNTSVADPKPSSVFHGAPTREPESKEDLRQAPDGPEDAQPQPSEPVRETPAVMTSLTWLARMQNGDGSFGEEPIVVEGYSLDKTAITSLALLSFSGAGYYHGSKDELDGKIVGDIVKKGLQWLMANQRNDGSIAPIDDRDSYLNNALAGLALNEAYGLTGSGLLKDPSRLITDYLCSLQRGEGITGEGGWGRDSSSAFGDSMTTAFAVEALFSAKLATTGDESTRIDAALKNAAHYTERQIRTTTDPLLAFAWIVLTQDRNDLYFRYAVEVMSEKITDFQETPLSFYLRSFGTFQYDSPSGDTWRQWNSRLKDSVLRVRSKEGIWGDRIRPDLQLIHTSLATLALEVYYRYKKETVPLISK